MKVLPSSTTLEKTLSRGSIINSTIMLGGSYRIRIRVSLPNAWVTSHGSSLKDTWWLLTFKVMGTSSPTHRFIAWTNIASERAISEKQVSRCSSTVTIAMSIANLSALLIPVSLGSYILVSSWLPTQRRGRSTTTSRLIRCAICAASPTRLTLATTAARESRGMRRGATHVTGSVMKAWRSPSARCAAGSSGSPHTGTWWRRVMCQRPVISADKMTERWWGLSLKTGSQSLIPRITLLDKRQSYKSNNQHSSSATSKPGFRITFRRRRCLTVISPLFEDGLTPLWERALGFEFCIFI